MKILFQSRVDLYNPAGGDTAQMEQTKKALEELDPNIKIDISAKLRDSKITNYDIVHLFNLDWVCETYLQVEWAKFNKKPVVLSAIHHSEDEVKIFEDKARYDIRRVYNFVIRSQQWRDMGKNLYRSIFNFKKLYPTLVQLFMGIRNQQKQILRMADMVLVQTNKEAEDIKKDFQIEDFKWSKVVNGVNTEIFNNPDIKNFKKPANGDMILNVGRIEPRKNQIKLIEAFEKLRLEHKIYKDAILVFIGAYNDHSYEYKYRFDSAVKGNPNIYYMGKMKSEEVASAMAQAKVYVQPSWFETTGLVSIEAALAGARVVATGERIKEYLGDGAVYCDPASAASIKNAIIRSFEKSFDSADLKQKMLNHYSWNQVAKETLQIYNGLL